MITPLTTPPLGTFEPTGIAVDHIGVVVHDLAREVAAWRQLGFTVSEPVALMSRDAAGHTVPLGQSSAHIVFANAYVELSSPVTGSGNHLEPYLAHGEGVRILVLATHDASASRAAAAAQWLQTSPVKSAERAVVIAGAEHTARFRWFSLPHDVVPGVLSAVVQHLSAGLVFHPSLVDHANDLRRVSRIVARGRRDQVLAPAGLDAPALGPPPLVLQCAAEAPAIIGIGCTATAGATERFYALTDAKI